MREILYRQKMLDAERAGILNWMLAGLKDYLALGDLRPPAIVCNATQRNDIDSKSQHRRSSGLIRHASRAWLVRKCSCQKSTQPMPSARPLSMAGPHPSRSSRNELRARGYKEDHPRNLTRFELRIKDDE